MVHDHCPCKDIGTDDTQRLPGGEVPSTAAGGPPLARRDLIAAGAAALALLVLDRLPGTQATAALARTLRQFHRPAGSRKVGNLKRLSANSALATTDPQTGQPAVIIRLSSKKQVKAYSAVCTHAGCTVQYDSGQRLLVCPCHNSIYDPAHGAAVVSGPAPSPLSSLKVAVDPKGNIWLV
jgi:Rieske Fe-S protein